jgi:hypothetical protein
VWEHRGKVAVAGVGHSPVDRRWDGVSMDKTLGAYSILACRKAMGQAGVTPDQIDGVICCDSHIAGGSGGSASQWAPRPYFAPPYDSEWGLTLVNAQWLIEQMRLPKVKFAPTGVPTISEMVGMAAHAVGDGLCHTCLVIYPTGNLEGRYRRGGENADDYARGARQWTAPRGNHGGNDFINIFPHNQYCLKYGGKHDDLAPFVTMGVQCHPQRTAAHHRGLRQFALHPEPAQALGLRPTGQCIGRVSLHDGRARPRHAAVAGLCAQSLTAQIQAAHHTADLDEIEDWTDRAASRMYEGAGLGPEDVDIFNPYDGYAPIAQFFPEAFQWHGVKRGDAFAFYAGDIRVEGPHPFCSSGANLENGRTAHPHGHVHRQHRAAPRHGWRTAGQGSGRDGAGGIHHSKQWRLDHVRQTPELTACDTGDHRLAAITLRPLPK